ncbi:MAG: lytic transglycosylase domain-containing protein [Chitinophagales bacterium]|nr:lytic transglycosylase domain-containing protein [Chitinophagales bacterium]
MNYLNKWLMPTFVTLVTLVVFKTFLLSLNENNKPNPTTKIAGMSLFINCQEAGDSMLDNGLNAPQRINPVRISGDVFFANERVPLNDQEVRERFDRELLVNTFWHSNTMLNYKLSSKYFDDIEQILEENGVPGDFKYLAVAESGLRNVVSPAGAAGYWQFLKSTGLEYGLEINNEVDERYDYVKATSAACDYLKDAKEKFGSWTLAAASYNIGMAKLYKRLNEQQVSNYYDLYLNSETSRYIFRILSYKMVFENPDKYGFNFVDRDLYQPYQFNQVVVENSIEDLAQFAIDNGTSYKMLKIVNPWLTSTKLTISVGNSYTIKIPTSYVNEAFHGADYELQE